MTVYLLWVDENEDGGGVLVGIYASRELAEQVIDRRAARGAIESPRIEPDTVISGLPA